MLQPGDIWDDKYEIIRHLADGGMGAVYQARQEGIDRDVVIKLVHMSSLHDPETRLRFEREALLNSRIKHPNIVTFYSYGVCQQIPYIVIEYLEGVALSEYLNENGPMSVESVLTLFIALCHALDSAHKQSVVHRDLKPNNIFLVKPAEAMNPKILDFGLAALSDPQAGQKLTATGLLVGSVYYMSPEQCRGARADARSDIYSLGCSLYECLAGEPPFSCDSPMGLIYKHMNDEAPELPARPGDKRVELLQRVIHKCMQKLPEDRYASVMELATDLEQIRTGEGQITAGLSHVKGGSKSASPQLIVRLSLLSLVLGLSLAAMALIPDPGPIPRLVKCSRNSFGKPDSASTEQLAAFLKGIKPLASEQLLEDLQTKSPLALAEGDLNEAMVLAKNKHFLLASRKAATAMNSLNAAAAALPEGSDTDVFIPLLQKSDAVIEIIPASYLVAFKQNRLKFVKTGHDRCLLEPILCGFEYQMDSLSDPTERLNFAGNVSAAFHTSQLDQGCLRFYLTHADLLNQLPSKEAYKQYSHLLTHAAKLNDQHASLFVLNKLLKLGPMVAKEAGSSEEAHLRSLWSATEQLCDAKDAKRFSESELADWVSNLLLACDQSEIKTFNELKIAHSAVPYFVNAALLTGTKRDRRSNGFLQFFIVNILKKLTPYSTRSEMIRVGDHFASLCDSRFSSNQPQKAMLLANLALFEQAGGREKRADELAAKCDQLLTDIRNHVLEPGAGLIVSYAYATLKLYESRGGRLCKADPPRSICSQDWTQAVGACLNPKGFGAEPFLAKVCELFCRLPEASESDALNKFDVFASVCKLLDNPDLVRYSYDFAREVHRLSGAKYFEKYPDKRARAAALYAWRLDIKAANTNQALAVLHEAEKYFWLNKGKLSSDRIAAGIEIARCYEGRGYENLIMKVLKDILQPQVVAAKNIPHQYILAISLWNNWAYRAKDTREQALAAVAEAKLAICDDVPINEVLSALRTRRDFAACNGASAADLAIMDKQMKIAKSRSLQ